MSTTATPAPVVEIPVPALPGWRLFVSGRSFAFLDPKRRQHSYEVKPGHRLSDAWSSIVAAILRGDDIDELDRQLAAGPEVEE